MGAYNDDGTRCRLHVIARGQTHEFDSVSGWCVHGCGNRADGRISTDGGSEVSPGDGQDTLPGLELIEGNSTT